MKRIALPFFYVLVAVNTKLVPKQSLVQVENPPHVLLAASMLLPQDRLGTTRLFPRDSLETARLFPQDSLETARLFPQDSLETARVVPKNRLGITGLNNPLDTFRSWAINRESGHCTIVASAEPYTSLDPSLFLSIHGAIEDINGNISSIRLRPLPREELKILGVGAYDAEGLARSGSWRYKACKCACDEALRQTCQIYNCHRIKEKFKSKCKKYCNEEFC